MPIEFHCRQCHNLLRTPDETAGQPAKCPQCGEITGHTPGSIGEGFCSLVTGAAELYEVDRDQVEPLHGDARVEKLDREAGAAGCPADGHGGGHGKSSAGDQQLGPGRAQLIAVRAGRA